MRGTRYTEEQIVGILKEQERGVGTEELCRRHGISQQTFYRWKAKYGGSPGDAQKLKGWRTKTGVSSAWSPISRLITLPSRTYWQKTGEARGQALGGSLPGGPVAAERASGKRACPASAERRCVTRPTARRTSRGPAASARAGGAEEALRLPAAAHAAQAGGHAGEPQAGAQAVSRGRAVAAPAQAQTSDQRGSRTGRGGERSEPGLEPGLRLRLPVRGAPVEAAHRGRHLHAGVAGHRGRHLDLLANGWRGCWTG